MSRPRILFVTGNRLGDAILSTGVLDGLVEACPGARVEVACGELPAPIFADLPGLERIHVVVKRTRNLHWLGLWAATVVRHWEVAADLRGSVLPYCLWAKRRLLVHADKRHEHRIEELQRILHLPRPPAPKIWVSPQRLRAAAVRLGDGAPILALGPGANWNLKRWPAERFVELIARLTGPDGILPGARIAVLAAPHEREEALPLLQSVPPGRLIDRTGGGHLLDLAAELQFCSFYVGNDSGLLHMAAAAGIPTLGLFGPTPEWRYGPWGARARVVRTPESYDELVAHLGYYHGNEITAMRGLTVDNVVEAAERLWRGGG